MDISEIFFFPGSSVKSLLRHNFLFTCPWMGEEKKLKKRVYRCLIAFPVMTVYFSLSIEGKAANCLLELEEMNNVYVMLLAVACIEQR